VSSCRRTLAALSAAVIFGGCSVGTASAPPPQRNPQETRAPGGRATGRPVDARQAERLQRVMIPLIRAMNNPRDLDKVRVGIIDDAHVNAASAGNGEFYVTRGLLDKASDAHLAGVLAHEVAHDDLNHVAKAQTLGAGLNIGMIILDQIIPGSGALTPIAGTLIARKYSRTEEYAADRHGVTILQRTGLSRDVMIDTLVWLQKTEGASSGGFLATHPGTLERIEALRSGQ
jgi:Zn-dependent protease with chaperone function